MGTPAGPLPARDGGVADVSNAGSLSRSTKDRRAWILDALAAIVLPACVVAGIYLLPFVRDPSMLPVGGDTPGYAWRAAITHEKGIAVLAEERRGLGMRPGHPIFVAALMGITGYEAIELAWVTPAIVAVCVALAAGCLASDGLKERRRRSLAYGIGLAGSSFIAWTAVGYASNLMLDAVALTLVLLAILAAFRGRGVLGGGLLIVGAILIHWLFALVLVGLLIAFDLALLVGRRFPAASRPPEGSARRVAMMIGGGLAGAALGMAVSPALPSWIPNVEPGGKGDSKVIDRLPSMALWLTGPLAVIGGILGLASRSAQRRWAAGVLLVWASLALVGVVGWFVLDLATPPYRFAGFALGIPLLIVFAASVIADRIRGKGGVARKAVAVTVVTLATVGLAATGAAVWWTQESRLQGEWFGQLETLERYIDAVGFEGPVLITIPTRKASILKTISRRAGLSRDLDEQAKFHQTPLPGAGRAMSAPEGAVVVFLSGFDERPTPPGELLAPGVVLLQGPSPSSRIEPAPPLAAPSPVALATLVLGSLLFLGFAGSGWTGLTGVDPVGRLALAPAFGVGVLPMAGLLSSRAGLPFDRPGSLVLFTGVAALGWVVDLSVRRFRRSTVDGAEDRA